MQPFTFPIEDTISNDMKAVLKMLKAEPTDLLSKNISNITGSTGADSEDKQIETADKISK